MLLISYFCSGKKNKIYKLAYLRCKKCGGSEYDLQLSLSLISLAFPGIPSTRCV
jgi:hypothetical protein